MHRDYTERYSNVPVMRELLNELELEKIFGDADFGAYSIKEPPIAVVKEDSPDEFTKYTAIGRLEDVEAFDALYEAKRKSLEEKAA